MNNPASTNLPPETPGEDALKRLALDLRRAWDRPASELWGRLDPELWDLTQNPWIVLQTVSRERLRDVSGDPAFRRLIDEMLARQGEAGQSPGWFAQAHPNSPLRLAAYFSMEYMLGEALPIYSGGLGNVAGDQLKAASDLDVPVVGIGLLYQQGYFRQEIDGYGNQQALYPFNDPGQLPIRPLREPNGEWLRISIALPGLGLWLRTWEVNVGRRSLYLLDSNDAANPPAYRGITSELYGGGPDLRIRQEIVLGIGGWRLLGALGLRPEVCHLNEGHAAFVVLERARTYMRETGRSFDAALAVTRAGNIFTTHTPVDAGFDRFSPDLVARYLSDYAAELGLSMRDLLALGRRNRNDGSEPFNMAYLAMRGCNRVNGVSRLHGRVSRGIFQPLYPRWPASEVPIGHVTNGVHVPTWQSREAAELWETACGRDCWTKQRAQIAPDFAGITDEQLWVLRTNSRRALVEYARKRLARQRAAQGASPRQIAQAGRVLDFDTLTLGFARRFAAYKRPNLLLSDPDRLIRLLTNPRFPVQLVLAGKAHPNDEYGRRLIREWHDFLRRPEAGSRIVFLSDYDMLLTQQLVQSVDVWINTPRRPWEASGTSGMKALVNGGLNLSELDGWWAEAYAPDVGWALGDGKEHGDDAAWDRAEADALYSRLEQEIVPLFYTRDERGIPRGWVAKMRESMSRLTPEFSAARVVRQYTEDHYLPAAAAYVARAADGGRAGDAIVEWRRALTHKWPHLHFGSVAAQTRDGKHFFEAEVYLDEVPPEDVRVELYAEPRGGGYPVRQPMARGEAYAGSAGAFVYRATVPADRPAGDYTPRIIPYRDGVAVPLETALILWQR